LNTGDPDEPGLVSVEYQITSSPRLRNWFSRTQICFRAPSGCWMIVSHSPSDALPVVSSNGKKPKCDSGIASSRDTGSTATTV